MWKGILLFNNIQESEPSAHSLQEQKQKTYLTKVILKNPR